MANIYACSALSPRDYITNERDDAGNEFASETLPGALPEGQNNPRVRLETHCLRKITLKPRMPAHMFVQEV